MSLLKRQFFQPFSFLLTVDHSENGGKSYNHNQCVKYGLFHGEMWAGRKKFISKQKQKNEHKINRKTVVHSTTQ